MALAACGTRDSVEPLLAALRDGDPLTAQAAGIALENLTGHTQELEAFAASRQRREDAAAWATWFGTHSWDVIERDLVERLQSGDRDEVRRAAVALGHVGGDAARDALRAYVASERAVNPYPEWRKDHQGDSATFNADSPANPRTLQEVTRALGYLRDQDAVALLADTLVAAC